MPRFFFDTRDDDALTVDDVGIEYPDLQAVRTEAARSLAELAQEVVPGSINRTLVVEVRDALGPVFEASMHFEAVMLRGTA